MQPQRDLYIDFLRFIGISLIILAHVEAPSGITQFRRRPVNGIRLGTFIQY